MQCNGYFLIKKGIKRIAKKLLFHYRVGDKLRINVKSARIRTCRSVTALSFCWIQIQYVVYFEKYFSEVTWRKNNVNCILPYIDKVL